MSRRQLEEALLEAIETLPVIDAHEHLPEETQRTAIHPDFSTLFSHYLQTDLKSAGMTSEQYDRFQSPDTPLDEKWATFSPFWERIKDTGYAQAARIAADELYDCPDLSASTYADLSKRMAAANTPGIYDRVLRGRCNIRACLTQIWRMPTDNLDLLIPILPVEHWTTVAGRDEMVGRAAPYGVEVAALDDYVQAMRAALQQRKSEGMVGLKMMSAVLPDPAPDAARQAFASLLSGHSYDYAPIANFLAHEILRLAGEMDLVVAVHCGIIWDNWNDFYQLHPRHMIPVLLRHRQTRFDLYHAGIPWVRDVGVMGKELPNAHLNLCWCHVISPRMTLSFLDEWLDLVPTHKIMGFGGDYAIPVEKVYGHLTMARRNIARVLAGRIADGMMTEARALEVARRMLFDNPRELYRLDVKE